MALNVLTNGLLAFIDLIEIIKIGLLCSTPDMFAAKLFSWGFVRSALNGPTGHQTDRAHREHCKTEDFKTEMPG